jgi:hypothetical protein
MTATDLPRTGGIEAELEQVYRDREQLLRATPCPARSQLIADQFDHEAWLWSALFERTRSSLTWRAALAAEAYARSSARWWRRNAAQLTGAAAASGEAAVTPASGRAAGRVGSPRLAALTSAGGG